MLHHRHHNQSLGNRVGHDNSLLSAILVFFSVLTISLPPAPLSTLQLVRMLAVCCNRDDVKLQRDRVSERCGVS